MHASHDDPTANGEGCAIRHADGLAGMIVPHRTQHTDEREAAADLIEDGRLRISNDLETKVYLMTVCRPLTFFLYLFDRFVANSH